MQADCVLIAGAPFIEEDGSFNVALRDIPTKLEFKDEDGSATVIILHTGKGSVRAKVNFDHLRPSI